MPEVDYQRPDFAASLPKWEMADDCDEGQERIHKAGDKYLPRPNPADKSPENLLRFEQYVKRAVFFNATSRTLGGLIGQVFGVDPEWEAPESIRRYEDDIDGGGVSLLQQSKETVRDVLKKGRAVLYTDFAAIDAEATNADIEQQRARPMIVLYDAKQVINWRVESAGAESILTLVVIREEVEDYTEDPFKPALIEQWRVMSVENGRFVTRIWRKKNQTDKTGERFEVFSEFAMLRGDGTFWDRIPLTFVGALNNDPAIDHAPIYDIAALNIAHYRNSADYEESAFFAGQPTLALTSSLDKTSFDAANPNGVALGVRGGLFLGIEGKAELIQAAPNSQPFEAMQHKERLMVALGARLVEQSQVQRTAKEASMEAASETSILANVANNVSEAYEQHLRWAAEYLNVRVGEDEIRYRLNTEYDSAALTAELLREITATWTLGGISDTEYRTRLKKAKVAFEDDEDWKDAALANPQGMPATPSAQPQQSAQQGGQQQ